MSVKAIKFSATWCPPCRMLQPIWDQLVDDLSQDGIQFESVDIDQEPGKATQYRVSAVPTIVFLKDGVVVDTLVGLRKDAELRSKLEGLVKNG